MASVAQRLKKKQAMIAKLEKKISDKKALEKASQELSNLRLYGTKSKK